MLLPAQRLLDALGPAAASLQGADATHAEASQAQAVATALSLLSARERGNTAAVQAQFRELASRLERWASLLPQDSPLRRDLEIVRGDAFRACGEPTLALIELDWRALLKRAESIMGRISLDKSLDPAVTRKLVTAIAEWEAGDLAAQLAAPAAPAVDERIDEQRLGAYLRVRFADPNLTVSAFRALPGGFGKQTYLFSAKGRELTGDFVIRRDMPSMFPDTDCHRVHREFRLIRSVYSAGFPAPQVLWVDTRHDLLPGGDFLVMRRAPGIPGGNVFAASGKVPPDLTHTLATILAKLHELPPIDELGDLTDSIQADVWAMPLQKCVRRYLEGWRTQFERETHLPSPSIAALFDWLIANIPPTRGQPVLLHGDVGFHNFLFDQGRLTAVLDWEFAHLGDPAEDLAYARNTLGDALNWKAFLSEYQRAGGVEVDARRIHFFQVWGHLRNAAAGNLVTAKFASGTVPELKMVVLPHLHMPSFLRAAMALIERGPDPEL